jgi:3-oxo-5-alpha-steroid 4-dehydrogenase 1
MTSAEKYLVDAVLVLAGATFVTLLFVAAPYGRHARSGWGPTVPSRIAWLVMESPSSIGFAIVFALTASRVSVGSMALFFLWQAHYVHRNYVYPVRMREKKRRMPLLIVALGFAFNCVNSFLNGRQIARSENYPASWCLDPRFVLGAALFVLGMAINIQSDNTLLRLRETENGGYRVPQGGLFQWVSCPNYLGEIIEWFGWAVASWSWAGLTFGIYTCANLLPRALAHHQWYRRQFSDYPAGRTAIIPYLL